MRCSVGLTTSSVSCHEVSMMTLCHLFSVRDLGRYVRVLFTLFGRSMELEANRTGTEASEPSNLMESMLSTVLVFLRECPQVGSGCPYLRVCVIVVHSCSTIARVSRICLMRSSA